MIRSREAKCMGRDCREAEEKEQSAIDALDLEGLVDLAVLALADYGVEEIDYDDDDLPAENEAICADDEGNEVGVEVKGKKLRIDLDEDNDIVVDLTQPVDDVKAEIQQDLEDVLSEQEDADEKEAEECNRRYNEWRRMHEKRKSGCRVPLRDRK